MNNQKIESKIELNTKTAYLTGAIVGDGNLSNSPKSKTDHSRDYRISIDLSDTKYLFKIYELIKSIIPTKTIPRKSHIKGNRVPRLHLFVRNKKLFLFFNEYMQIPAGNKSFIVFVPPRIMTGSNNLKRYFLAGYFDADGGFRGHTLGFTTASKKLNEGISNLLEYFKINHVKEKWNNKKYAKDYYGIKIKKKEIDSFLNLLPLQNEEKIIRIRERFPCGDAGAVKRDR